MAIHVHPQGGAQIEGRRIDLGETLLETDLYAASDGAWRLCPCPGNPLMNETVPWVRIEPPAAKG